MFEQDVLNVVSSHAVNNLNYISISIYSVPYCFPIDTSITRWMTMTEHNPNLNATTNLTEYKCVARSRRTTACEPRTWCVVINKPALTTHKYLAAVLRAGRTLSHASVPLNPNAIVWSVNRVFNTITYSRNVDYFETIILWTTFTFLCPRRTWIDDKHCGSLIPY